MDLPRSGRPAHDGQQRGVEVAQPRQEVVVDLVDDAPGGPRGLVPPGAASPKDSAATRSRRSCSACGTGRRSAGAVTSASSARLRVRRAPEQTGEVRRVGRERLRGRGHRLGDLVEVVVVAAAHGHVVPVGAALRRDGEADVVQPLEQVGGDLVRAVLVADDGDDGDLAADDRAAGVVGLRQLAVQPLEHPLGDAAHVPDPGGRGDDQDVAGQHLLADRRPGVALAHVHLDAGLHVVVDDADRRR